MTRENVYRIIDAERNYQDLRWNQGLREDLTPDKDKSVAEWLIYMEVLISEAKKSVYHLKKDDALALIRKITAVGVAAMEIHGAPEREN